MKIPDSKYDQLLAYIESGAKGNLPRGLIEYVELLDLIRSMYSRYESREAIINFIYQKPYNLSPALAAKRFSEAMNFFYLDNEVRKKAWRNIYAEKLDRAANLVLKTAENAADIEIFKKIIDAAARMRQLDKIDPPEIPKQLYDKPYKIYSLDPATIGRKRPDKRLLAKKIDELPDTPEAEKESLKEDALINTPKFFQDADEAEDY